jgi:hypothetical protein
MEHIFVTIAPGDNTKMAVNIYPCLEACYMPTTRETRPPFVFYQRILHCENQTLF